MPEKQERPNSLLDPNGDAECANTEADMRIVRSGLAAAGLAATALAWDPGVTAQQKQPAEKSNMELVGYSDLQGRSAYQPLVHKQGDRFIAYVGHHGGSTINAVTGKTESNGTSIVDVTNPKQPKYLAHIPGEPGQAEQGGAQMVRVCDGATLPRADRNKVYLLRSMGNTSHEIWDVTDPSKPARLTVVVSGLRDTHKSWWECDTGIAYLVTGVTDWRTRRMTSIYDLSDPAKPVFIRYFGLPGQQPGSTGPVPTDLHGPISTGSKGNRVYFGYGTGGNGILQIVDRNKLLNGPKDPTDANLLYPQVVRLDLPADAGAHTTFPMLGMTLPEFANQKLRPDAGRQRFHRGGGRDARERVFREPADGTDGRRDGRVEAVRRVELDGPGSERQVLREGRTFRHALVAREHDADLLQPRAVRRALQRRRARARRARSVQREGNRLLYSRRHRQDRQTLRRPRWRRALQGRHSDEQRRRRRSWLHLHRRSREHRHAHPGTHGSGT
jgi:hypothetical protein